MMKSSVKMWVGGLALLGLLMVVTADAQASHTILFENFGAGIPVEGWSTIIATGDVNWAATADEASNLTSVIPGRGLAAGVDSQSTTSAYDASLITPEIYIPNASQLSGRFMTIFETWTGFESADVDVQVVGESAWTNVAHFDNNNIVEGQLNEPVDFSLLDFADQTVQIRFRYYNDLSGLGGASFFGDMYWQIDDVRLTAGNLWGDADHNGVVDLDDFVILKTNFGITGASWSKGDFDEDGDVDLEDFIILKKNFGGTVFVPEPLTISLIAAGGLLAGRRRKN